MIFSAPRFVVVDDKETHLLAITRTLQLLGAPCLGVRYDGTEELEPDHFRGVRCLFMDLHLIDGVASTDHRRHFAHIAEILEGNISASGGPFILVVWSQLQNLDGELRDYLDESIDSERPHARPLAVLGLAKENFINLDDGTITNYEGLRKEILDKITANPQIAALLGWEADVLTAAGDTLAELLKLVPAAERVSNSYPRALDTILSRLAREAVGRPNVGINHRTAITTALAPILADRVINQKVAPETAELWTRAVTRYNDDSLQNASVEEAGRINRMLHVAILGSETILPTDWGAVVDVEENIWNSDDRLRQLFDGSRSELLKEEFKIKEADYGKCRPCLVRVGAACDYAQKRRGPLTYLLGLEIPTNLKRSNKASGAEWESPVLMVNGDGTPFRLHVNVRFSLVRPASSCGGWKVRYRLREQLLMLLLSHSTGYTARPGIVQLPAK
ncbi:MAG: hypothetical protein RKO66_17315 [Candidatus Contendobacter sp.]|nr:hypothetical protein [Candidatus Contendobacter sp.]